MEEKTAPSGSEEPKKLTQAVNNGCRYRVEAAAAEAVLLAPNGAIGLKPN